MREDIHAARKRLNIGKPVLYRECLKTLEREGKIATDLDLGAGKAA